MGQRSRVGRGHGGHGLQFVVINRLLSELIFNSNLTSKLWLPGQLGDRACFYLEKN